VHIKTLLYNRGVEVSRMKNIINAVIIVIVLTVLKWAAFLLLPMKYSFVVSLLQIATRVFIIAYLLWFFWPYIKRGINYLVDHRND